MAAPTLAAVSIVTGTGNTKVSASLSFQVNDVVIVTAVTEGAALNNTFASCTTTLAGQTVTQLEIHAASNNGAGAAWSFTASAAGSGTVTVTQSSSVTDNCAMGVYVFRGSAGVGSHTLAASSSRTVSLTPAGADGAIVWSVSDWGAAAVQTATPTATSHTSASPGPSATPAAALVGTSYTYYVEELDDQTSAGAVSYGILGSGTGPFTIVAVEAKASGSGGTTVKPRRVRNEVPIIRAANF